MQKPHGKFLIMNTPYALNLPIAPAGKSGAFCPVCKKHAELTDENLILIDAYYCCGRSLFSETLAQKGALAIRPEVLQYDTPEKISTSVWLHATTHSEWYEDLFYNSILPLVHLGDSDAAFDRYRQKKTIQKKKGEFDKDKWFLYVVGITPNATIAPAFVNDENAEAPRFVDDTKMLPEYNYDIIPYINTFEAIGSISLFANPNAIRVIERYSFADIDKDDRF